MENTKRVLDKSFMLISILPKLSVSQFMGYLNGKSSLMIFVDMQI
ncbi:transposase [Niallia circulans]|nr:transposase [Niallia circulans]